MARAQGDFLTGADRYARAEEFLTVAKVVLGAAPSLPRRLLRGRRGRFRAAAVGAALPRGTHWSGTSPEAWACCGRHGWHVHVFAEGDDLDALVPELPVAVRRPHLSSLDHADEYAWGWASPSSSSRPRTSIASGEHVEVAGSCRLTSTTCASTWRATSPPLRRRVRNRGGCSAAPPRHPRRPGRRLQLRRPHGRRRSGV